MNTIYLIQYFFGVYLFLGILFSIYFLWKAIERFDEGAKGSGLGIRLIIFPGTEVFWPLLLNKLLSLKTAKK